jgi:hypothetical protein
MKTDPDNTANERLVLQKEGSDNALLRCEDMQMLLFAYMTRELGDVQSRVVREHLRTCATCRQEASEIDETLAALRAGADVSSGDLRLSDERRARLWRAVFHPVLDWIDHHHRLVAGVVALLSLLLTIFFLRHAAIWKQRQLEEGIPIWRMFRSGKLPVLVDQVMQQKQGEPVPKETE